MRKASDMITGGTLVKAKKAKVKSEAKPKPPTKASVKKLLLMLKKAIAEDAVLSSGVEIEKCGSADEGAFNISLVVKDSFRITELVEVRNYQEFSTDFGCYIHRPYISTTIVGDLTAPTPAETFKSEEEIPLLVEQIRTFAGICQKATLEAFEKAVQNLFDAYHKLGQRIDEFVKDPQGDALDADLQHVADQAGDLQRFPDDL